MENLSLLLELGNPSMRPKKKNIAILDQKVWIFVNSNFLILYNFYSLDHQDNQKPGSGFTQKPGSGSGSGFFEYVSEWLTFGVICSVTIFIYLYGHVIVIVMGTGSVHTGTILCQQVVIFY